MALTVLLSWRFRARAFRPGPAGGGRPEGVPELSCPSGGADPSTASAGQTPIARFTQTSPTSMPTFS
jgi:hypothetical protein